MLEAYPDDQRDEWMSVARGGALRTPPAPVIARRSSEWRRSEASVDGRDDLATEKGGDDVKKLRREERKQEGCKGEAGDAGVWPELKDLPAAMAARRGRFRAAWRRID